MSSGRRRAVGSDHLADERSACLSSGAPPDLHFRALLMPLPMARLNRQMHKGIVYQNVTDVSSLSCQVHRLRWAFVEAACTATGGRG